MPSKSKVYFFFEKTADLPRRRKLKKFIEYIFKNERRELRNLNCIFCSDRKILAINKKYLKHDYYTDIITFDLSENPKTTDGDIYISVDRVKDNAFMNGESLTKELHRVIFHGVLHLCGFDDKSKKERKMMREKETIYLKKYHQVSRDTVSERNSVP